MKIELSNTNISAYKRSISNNKMEVIKRDGNKEQVEFVKVQNRIKWLVNEPFVLNCIDVPSLTQAVISHLFNGIKTTKIDSVTAEYAASLSVNEREYGILAGRIVINDHHKNTLTSFMDKNKCMYDNLDRQGKRNPLINNEQFKFIEKNQKVIEEKIDYARDYDLDYFGFKTLENGYLIKSSQGVTIERPQDLFMRVAIALHLDPGNYKSKKNIELVFETYDLMSNRYFTHATPTLFNAGTCIQQLSSCLLLHIDDSLEGIMLTATNAAKLSKASCGIGFPIGNLRGKNAPIRSTNGISNGIVPFMKIFNEVARAFNQGGGKKSRPGAFAVYNDLHHPDIEDFLKLRLNSGDETLRTRDLFLGVCINDLWMERCFKDQEWSLFDPDECKDLTHLHGDEYRKKYIQYEKENKAVKTIKARTIAILLYNSAKDGGLPYALSKDRVNYLSNQSNLGCIRTSNLCMEITLFTSKDEYGVCNLASICLPKYVIECNEKTPDGKADPNYGKYVEFPKKPRFDFEEFLKVVRVCTRNTNKVIDINFYPVIEAKNSNFKHRPIGIGVQGLADVFQMFRVPYVSKKARHLNKCIFEALYYGALSESNFLAKAEYKRIYAAMESGEIKEFTYNNKKYTDPKKLPTLAGTYQSYLWNGGSHIANGKFHWELFGVKPSELSGMFGWEKLRQQISIYGIRNSQLIALMPTASTSQIMGNTECFEPRTSNLYRRKTSAGEFIVSNKYLFNHLREAGVLNNDMVNYLKSNGGSIHGVNGIPDKIKEIYETVWRIKQIPIIEMASDRQAFIDMSQSMNLYVEDLTFSKYLTLLKKGHEGGLKTLCYYMRSRPATDPQKFTIDPDTEKRLKKFTVDFNDSSLDGLAVDDAPICLSCQ
jgi:ribonucleoside-diphosphate reductase alpha chain